MLNYEDLIGGILFKRVEIWMEVTLASPRSPEIFSFGVVHVK